MDSLQVRKFGHLWPYYFKELLGQILLDQIQPNEYLI